MGRRRSGIYYSPHYRPCSIYAGDAFHHYGSRVGNPGCGGDGSCGNVYNYGYPVSPLKPVQTAWGYWVVVALVPLDS